MDVDHVDFDGGGGGDVDMADENESNDAASSEPPPRRSSRHEGKGKVEYKDSVLSSEEESQSEEEEEEEVEEDNESSSDRGRISKADYAEYTDDLAELILPHLIEYREKKGKDMQRFPTHLRAEILDSYLKENKLIGRVNTETFWNIAATKARDGKIVKPNKGGREAGETSITYEHTIAAETSAKRCTEDGTSELIARFNGDIEKTKEFAGMGLALREKRKKFEEEHEKLGNKPETAEEAMSKLTRVVEGKKIICVPLVHIISSNTDTLSLFPTPYCIQKPIRRYRHA